MPNMRQIARLAGVSLTTVSLALRDHPNISMPTREKVKEIARKLNYALPEQKIPGFGSGRVIGYVIHDWFGLIATDMLRGAAAEAEKYKFGILMMQVGQHPAWVEETINNLLDIGISGLVMAHSLTEPLPRRILLALRSRGIHVVQVMNKVFADPLDSVCRNEHEYARLVAEHLAALGHRRIIAFMSYRKTWEQAFHHQGLELTIVSSVHGAVEVDNAFEAFTRMTPQPTAIVAAMDDDAYRLYNLALLHGYAVPADLSIIGFGNIFVDYLYPEITTVDMKAREMGAIGIRLLAERMAAGVAPHEVTDFQEILLPATVIDRGSTGPAKR